MRTLIKHLAIYISTRLSITAEVIFILCCVLCLPSTSCSQTYNVQGNITTRINDSIVAVKNALVTYTDQNDLSKIFTSITDSAGKYDLSIITKVSPQPFVLPQSIELAQNYPNPFSSSTVITYQLRSQSDVSIKIFDILGREIRAFKLGIQGIGTHRVIWDGKDNLGGRLAVGIYFYQLQTGKENIVKKMVYTTGNEIFTQLLKEENYNFKEVSNKNNKLKKESNDQLAQGTYTVLIQSLNCTTNPQIATKEFNNITVQGDTTINFEVPLAGAVPPAPVYPSPYGSPIWHPDGKIAFNWRKIHKINICTGRVRNSDIDWDSTGFWIINPDGTGLQKLLPYGFSSPAWSPDGQWIAFEKYAQIFKMKFTGTGFDTTTLIQLTSGGSNFFPAWSPDGKWIAYEQIEGGPDLCGIWLMKTNGSEKQILFSAAFPAWNPNNNIILGCKGTDPYSIWTRFFKYDLIQRKITDTLNASIGNVNTEPQYSPNGNKIAFVSQTSWDVPQIWIMNADETNLQQLTTSGAGSFSWSPDGSQIVYIQYDGRKADFNNGTIWITNADGSNKRQLTYNYGLIFEP